MKAWLNQIRRPQGRLSYVLAFIYGAIYPLGLAPLAWWPVLFLSVVGFIVTLEGEATKRCFKISYCYGVGFFGTGASWVYVSIHEFGHAPVILAAFLTVLFVLALALFKALIGVIAGISQRRWRQTGYYAAFPVAWLLSDWVQGGFLTGFPWLYLGYGLVDTPFSSWVSVVGVLGSSFLTVAMTSLVVSVFRASRINKFEWQVTAAVSFILFLGALGYGLRSQSEMKTISDVSITLVQPNIPQEEKWRSENLRKYLQMYDEMTAPHWGSEIIVWPEAAIPALKHRVANWLDHWNDKAKSSESHLFLGIPRAEVSEKKLYASFISLGGIQLQYDKQHLVPFGEFVPFEDWLRGMIAFFNLPMSSFSPGSEAQPVMQTHRFNVLPAICYEIAYSSLFRNQLKNIKNQRDSIIITVSNDAWFGASFGPHQHFQIARARALEFGIPVLRATNNGISAVIDADGEVLSQLPQFEKDTLSTNTSLKIYETPYSLFPNIGIILSILFSVGAIVSLSRSS